MRRLVWQIMLAAVVALSLIGLPAQAWEVGLVTGVEGEVQATLGKSKPWHPLLGESLPDGTVVETPPGGHLKLLHLGLKQEVTIPEGQRAVLTATGITGARYQTEACIDDLPASLALSAASHEQLGAVDVATIDSGSASDDHKTRQKDRGERAGSSYVSLEPQSRQDEADKCQRELKSESALPTLPPGTPLVAPAPVPTSTSVESSQVQPSGPADQSAAYVTQREMSEDFLPKDEVAKESSTVEELAKRDKVSPAPLTKKLPTQDLQAGSSAPLSIRLALPDSILGRVPQKGDSVRLAFQGRTIDGTARVDRVVSMSTESWVLIDVDLAAWPSSDRTIEVALTLPGQAASRRLVLVRPDGAVKPGLVEAARFQGHRGFAQAAAIWLDLAASRSLSPIILDQHLQRLAAELKNGGSASPNR